METIKISYTLDRLIQTLPIEKDFVAFRDVSKVNGIVISEVEGITTTSHLQAVKDNEGIKQFTELFLCKKEIVEAHKHQNIYHRHEDLVRYVIRNPFTAIQEQSLDGFILLNVAYNSHDLYFLNGERLVKPVYFDNANGCLGDEYYDLKAVVNKLKDRHDLIWDTDRRRKDSYIISDFSGTYVKFRLIPTDEVWEQIKGLKSQFDVQNYVKQNILDIEPFRREDDEEYND